MGDNKDLTELQGKIDKIVELTRASRDEAVVALHDCDDQLDKAIDMILEGDSASSEWRSIGKKRKPKGPVVSGQSNTSTQNAQEDKSHPNDSTKASDKKGLSSKGPGRGGTVRGGPVGTGKLANRKPRGEDKANNENTTNENDENTVPDDSNNTAPSKNLGETVPIRVARGGHGGIRGRDRGGVPVRGGFSNRGGGRNTRMFQNKGYRNNIAPVSNNSTSVNDFPNSIDTWTNSTAEQVGKRPSGPGADGNTITVGNWSDFVSTEDWSEEDWDSNLMETKVFTPSTKAVSEKDSVGGMSSNPVGNSSQGLNFSSLLAKQTASEPVNQHNQQPISSILGSNMTRNPTASSAGAALLQQIQQGVSSASQINRLSLSQYSKQASENIKSLVGIPSSTYSSSTSNMLSGDSLDNQVNELSSHRQIENLNEVSQQGSSKPPPPRLTKMRSSKIPESAVEMPSNDSISALNVQFGALPFDLGPETSNAFHDVVNHVKSSNLKGVSTGPSSATGSGSGLSSAALLNVGLSDNSFRSAPKNNNQPSGVKVSAGGVANTSDLVLQNSVLAHQSLSSEISGLGGDRSKNQSVSSGYGTKSVLDNTGSSSHNESNLYQSVATSQVQSASSSQQQPNDLSGYKSTSYQQVDPTTGYNSSNTYGTTATTMPPYVYSNTNPNQNAGMAYSATGTGYSANYRSTQSTTSHTSAVPVSSHMNNNQKPSTIKDLDPPGSLQHKHAYDLQGVPIVGAGTGASLGPLSNSTMTTNVLKNSLTATGKGMPNVPPGVPPILGTQYIMSQTGLPGVSFYPFYDVQIPTAHGRDHSFAYQPSTDLKYSRAENDGSNTVSTQSPVSQAHNQAIFGQIPHAYSFFYAPTPPGVNMMPQSLYGPPAPFLPVPPATNAHTGSTGSGFPKGTTGYGSHTYAPTPYDSLNAVPAPSDYVKTNTYAPSSGQQQVKSLNTSNASDLSVSNAMYGKNHPQLNKTYEKGNFQSSATPPPFNMAGAPQANTLGSTYAPNPLYLQPTQPSMLHHTLQGDASQSLASGVSGQRTLSQAQKGSAANSKYYWA
ncbi:uncharacterized protein LOC141852170 isoform X2 [Brevipalpus obovatus]|uniref:uncharacterized protein LOC141852170 isoform X2 n=1 Tax=Brevipalpus obovatus TaxID=246614 RepID=UPI003D9E8D88